MAVDVLAVERSKLHSPTQGKERDRLLDPYSRLTRETSLGAKFLGRWAYNSVYKSTDAPGHASSSVFQVM